MNDALRCGLFLLGVSLTCLPSGAWAWDCKDLHASAHLVEDASSGDSVALLDVWDALYPVFKGLSGRDTRMLVLSEDARTIKGKPFPPNAAICDRQEGIPPTIYITHAMVELVLHRKRFPVDFLAFVIGHELGHRMNDLTPEGAFLSGRGGKGKREIRADVRGAFFAASAGFQMRKLACDETVLTFLDLEMGVSAATANERQGQLVRILNEFDAWSGLYDVAVGLVFLGGMERQLGIDLLSWADQELSKVAAPLPEYRVLQAVALLEMAAPTAPWLTTTGLGDSGSHLRCQPLFSTRTQLNRSGFARRGRGDSTATLMEVRELLESARDIGAADVVVETGLACTAFYLGTPEEMRRGKAHLARALELVPRGSGRVEALDDALESNRVLLEAGLHLSRDPVPADATGEEGAAWRKELKSVAKMAREQPRVGALLTALSKGEVPMVDSESGELSEDITSCGSRRGKKAAFKAPVSPVPTLPSTGGKCPCGWSLLHQINGAATGGSSVVTCVPTGVNHGERFVHIGGKGQTQGLNVLMQDGPRGASGHLAYWLERCSDGRDLGLSQEGERILLAQCQSIGLDRVVLVTDGDCGVQRLVALGRP